jgi:hypothetical protein
MLTQAPPASQAESELLAPLLSAVPVTHVTSQSARLGAGPGVRLLSCRRRRAGAASESVRLRVTVGCRQWSQPESGPGAGRGSRGSAAPVTGVAGGRSESA